MAFPIHLLTKIIKPVLGLVVSTDPTGQDSVVAKNWRPWTMVTFVLMIVVSVFTDLELSDATITAIGAVLIVMVGGRSYEKKSIEKAIDAIKKLDK